MSPAKIMKNITATVIGPHSSSRRHGSGHRLYWPLEELLRFSNCGSIIFVPALVPHKPKRVAPEKKPRLLSDRASSATHW
jgi:hypothetical protein